MVENQNSIGHNIVLNDRSNLTVYGIKSVSSFSEDQISVVTVLDELLYIEGHELNVKEVNLEKGFVEASGVVSGMFYENKIFDNKKFRFFKGVFNRE